MKEKQRRILKKSADAMRREYDFSTGVRGVTFARYRKGTNAMLIDPAVMDVFPNGDSVNETLRALAVIVRRIRKTAHRGTRKLKTHAHAQVQER